MKFLGLDVGTTRMKCGVYNEKGVLEYQNSVDYGELHNEKESYIDVDTIFSSAFALLKKAYQNCPFDSIAISSLGESFVLLDKKDNVIFYPMLYTDPRGKAETDEQMKNAEKFFSVSGVYPQGMYSAYKLLWIKKNRPNIYKEADKVLLVNEYISYKLTGIRAIDYSQAARTGLFDVREKKFSGELCDLLGIDKALFSPAVPSGTIIEKVKNDIAKEWGADKPVFVVAGGHDQVCATLGSGVTKAGDCSDGMGTVECLTAVYESPSCDGKMGEYGYPNVPFLDKLYCTYLLNYSCGSLTRWWLSTCFSEEEIKKGTAFEKIEKDFTDVPTGLLVLPYFAGAATPYQNIEAKGAILNLTISDNPSKVYQGILEGLCFEMKFNLETTKKFGIKPKKLIATGGGSASKKWLQIKADVLGIPVYPLKVKEAGVCGAAILGASALLKENINNVVKRFVKLERAIKPRKEIQKMYSQEYKKYKKIYRVVKEFY